MRSKNVLFTAAALSGLMAGASAIAASAPANSSGASSSLVRQAGTSSVHFNATHACKGQNDCKGQGGCKTSDGGCKGKNSCKGKGGCSTAATSPSLAL